MKNIPEDRFTMPKALSIQKTRSKYSTMACCTLRKLICRALKDIFQQTKHLLATINTSPYNIISYKMKGK